MGAIVVGLLATVFIVIGARIGIVNPDPETAQQSTRLIRVFAFGAGAFLTAVCLDFLPDAWALSGEATAWWLFLGVLALWAVNSMSDGWFAKEMVNSLQDAETAFRHPLRFRRTSGIVLAAALSFHTFLEGTAVAVSFHDMAWGTLMFAAAVILHKLPEGILWALSLSSVFTNDKASVFRILMIPAGCTLLGTMIGVYFAADATPGMVGGISSVVAGAMLYIAFCELVPGLREVSSPKASRFWFVIGVAVMLALNGLSHFVGD